ncbi:hypothetical protein SAMN02745664_10782 [Moraxella cuniculi DSM 21768]|uniref:Uncharacterized protein n=1 Tax=Moraxella cuniculi DSM 21768 TaxID=1122245 RepID=A0A1N7EU90_9GAMM|nr:hypothetical protein SAMN02745664_10782 [Moraxella cuniculi DSM 21768]
MRKSALFSAVLLCLPSVYMANTAQAAYGWNPATVHSATSTLASDLLGIGLSGGELDGI